MDKGYNFFILYLINPVQDGPKGKAALPRLPANFTDPSAKGRPGRKTLDELQERYRAKMLLVWERMATAVVNLFSLCHTAI